MIRWAFLNGRCGSMPAAPDDMMHHGALNSALKNNAPFSRTALKTSDSTSIALAHFQKWAFELTMRAVQSSREIRFPA